MKYESDNNGLEKQQICRQNETFGFIAELGLAIDDDEGIEPRNDPGKKNIPPHYQMKECDKTAQKSPFNLNLAEIVLAQSETLRKDFIQHRHNARRESGKSKPNSEKLKQFSRFSSDL